MYYDSQCTRRSILCISRLFNCNITYIDTVSIIHSTGERTMLRQILIALIYLKISNDYIAVSYTHLRAHET